MWGWMLAHTHRRHRQLLLHNLYMSDVYDSNSDPPHSQHSFEDWGGEAWKGVDALAAEEDACNVPFSKFLGYLKEGRQSFPHFLHYSQGYFVNNEDKQETHGGFSKCWNNWGGKPNEKHVIERCELD